MVIIANRKPSGEHQGHFNVLKTVEETFLIVGQDFEKGDIVLNCRDPRLVQISETHHAYTLQSSLIFCHGKDGYDINIPQHDVKTKTCFNKIVSVADFYS